MSNNTTKPAVILQLEQELGIELTEVALEKVRKNGDSFALNQQGEVVGLNLEDNQISELTGLEQLSQLTSLVLWNNQVSDLTGLEGLSQLTSLDLGGNQINNLIPLEKLSQLTFLNLDINQISDLTGLEKLPQLTSLSLGDNKINEISLAFLSYFPSLKYLWFCMNPIQNIPKEIFDKTENVLNEVKHYLEDIEKGQRKVYQLKVILIGNGRVGKTCLVKRWLDHTFDPEEKSTHAIQLRRHFLKQLAKEKGFDEIQLQIWDFGGQDIYHATHRLFMQTNALFILVWDQKIEQTPFQTEQLPDGSSITYQNYPLRYWLDYAKNLGNNSPILIIQTKKDRDGKCEIKDWNFLKENYNIIESIVVESSKEKRNGFDQFESCLEEHIETMLKETCTALPTSWWKVQLDIQKLQSKLTKNITVDKFHKICQKYELNQDHAKTLLQYLHDTGLLFYKENYFQNQLILDQKWAIDAVYTLFDRKGLFPRLVQKGIFSTQDLKYAWQNFSQEEQELCLNFMKSCEICFEIDTEWKPFEERRFLAPALLPENKPIELNDVWQCLENKRIIRYRYHFLHYGNVQSFIVRTNEWSNPQSLWKNGCQLTDDSGNLALIEGHFSQQKQYLEIQITGKNPQTLLDKIRNELEKIQQYDNVTELWSIDGVSFVEREKLEKHPKENLKIQTIDGNWLNYSDFALFLNKNPKETFFMPSLNLHEQKIKDLEDILALALKKKALLTKAKTSETDVARKFQIEQQLEELMQEIEKHEKELAKLAGNSPAKRTKGNPTKTIASESPKPSNKKIYFSYAWGDKEKGETREEIVNQLYDSLEKDGYTLKRDKMDLGYRGFISDFMQEIGEGDLIVVVISDKYVKSPYCMFELYEIARNCKFDKSLFAQRILPVMVEFIDFSDPFILDLYFEHWEKEEQKWTELVKKRADKISPEQFNRYEKIKQIHSNIGKLGDWLIDMNTLNPKMLSENNFEEIKKAIQESN